MSDQIHWTPKMFKRFKVAYNAAVENKSESFMFDDNQFVVQYAKYLIEYLEQEFKK